MRTWADDLRRLCDALGLDKPVVLGSSFGGDVALSYAGLFPDHPGGVILANTTGGPAATSSACHRGVRPPRRPRGGRRSRVRTYRRLIAADAGDIPG